MDKIVLKFIADLLYVKGMLYFEEFDAIMNVKSPSDLDDIIDNMMREVYSPYKKGDMNE